MNFDRVRRHIPLNEELIDRLSKWSKGLKQQICLRKLPFDEGVIHLRMITMEDVLDADIYFDDKNSKRLKVELYLNGEFNTQWYINKSVPMSISGVTYESIPNEVQIQMTAILIHTMCYITLYHNDINLVGGKKENLNEIIHLTLPDPLPVLPGGLRVEPATYNFSKGFELAPNKPIKEQVESHLNDYYLSWLNQPIPALKGKTPIEASKSSEGMKELYELFDYMHKLNSPVPFPFNEMKKILGM